ncbi:gibberellin-regulated protein 14-like [Amaranthus tricolor]|uniref:gibberellin-regulated protein 14-like n=1 Tax=Amaranthus tricolor TaxID=29722 RepID=UPI002588B061|nr:gibberellin-regulated protein 14-like [Amaranthus tricolor]
MACLHVFFSLLILLFLVATKGVEVTPPAPQSYQPPKAPVIAPYPPKAPIVAPYPSKSPGVAPYPPKSPVVAPYPPKSPVIAPYPPKSPVVAPYPPKAPAVAPYPPKAPVVAPYPPKAPVVAPYPPKAPVVAPYPPKAPIVAPTTPYYGHLPPVKKEDCVPLCEKRCSLHSRKRLCVRACSTCCLRCKCVPPGTYGNKEVCGRCYTDMTTHGGRLKCP